MFLLDFYQRNSSLGACAESAERIKISNQIKISARTLLLFGGVQLPEERPRPRISRGQLPTTSSSPSCSVRRSLIVLSPRGCVLGPALICTTRARLLLDPSPPRQSHLPFFLAAALSSPAQPSKAFSGQRERKNAEA